MRGLYSIVDPDFCAGRDPVWVAREILSARVRILQLRVKHRPMEVVRGWAEAIMALKREYDFTFIVNDFPFLALDIGADGVHVGQDDMPISEVRRVMGPDKIVGLSTHAIAEVMASNALPVDYIGFGAVFKTIIKDDSHPTPGPVLLREALSLATHPIVAIGGITVATLPQLLDTGATCYAVLSAISQADDVAGMARRLMNSMPLV